MTTPTADQVTLLGGLELATEVLAELRLARDNLIVGAIKAGATQTQVARAAGVSQAHISRLVNRPARPQPRRKATRGSRRNRESGTV